MRLTGLLGVTHVVPMAFRKRIALSFMMLK
jgi:hypothetical protein